MSTDKPSYVDLRPAPCDHAAECALLYGDGPDAPWNCDCKNCCTECQRANDLNGGAE